MSRLSPIPCLINQEGCPLQTGRAFPRSHSPLHVLYLPLTEAEFQLLLTTEFGMWLVLHLINLTPYVPCMAPEGILVYDFWPGLKSAVSESQRLSHWTLGVKWAGSRCLLWSPQYPSTCILLGTQQVLNIYWMNEPQNRNNVCNVWNLIPAQGCLSTTIIIFLPR